MKRSTAWWVVGLLMLFVGMLLSRMHDGAAVPATPSGIALVLATCLGYAVGVALIPLILAIVTRFRHPWIILGTYGLCVLGVIVALRDNQLSNITTNVATRSAEVPSSQSPYVQMGIPSRTDNTSASPSATASVQWAEASGAFIAAHHDLNQSQNLGIMQEKLDTIYAPTLTYPELLEQAYQAARRDSRWVDTSRSGAEYSTGSSFPNTRADVAANSPAYIENQDNERIQQQVSYPNTPHNRYCWHHYYQIIDRLPNDMGLGDYVNTRDNYLKKMHECLRR